ncbi:MAG: DUF1294 domain-containing protein [Terrisporobacter sp.]|uniref:DUF1294 domain-containing protein n=1 Tax=Terrisporobacter sp. TaxID=1965305 RepID=UPI002FC6DF14
MFLYLMIINIIGFILMFSDKRKAINHKYRIPEKNLFLVCALGGSAGSLMGMYTFRHKTKHNKFVVGVPILLILNIICVIFITFKLL